jgi:SAM-dependent methyltransferase
LWTDPYISQRMLELHLDPALELASRSEAFIRSSIEWIASRFPIESGLRVADFGCGPGLYTTPLARRGARVTGIDFSERSIRYARERAAQEGLDVEYVLGDYLDYRADEPFDLILMIFLDFGALDPTRRRRLLEIFRGSLKSGGSLLLDVPTLARFDTIYETRSYEYVAGDGFWAAGPHFVFHNSVKYAAENVLLNKYSIVQPDRLRESFHWMQCYSLKSLAREFADNGFQITAHYGNVAGVAYESASQELAIVAQKDAG